MKISKYDGLGNTFAIINYEDDQQFDQLSPRICHHEKIKTDGMIIVKRDPELEMIFYNQDGSLAPMCGNGIRAFSKYVLDQSMIDKNTTQFQVQTGVGSLTVDIIEKSPFLCQIEMGEPRFTPQDMRLSDAGRLHRILNIDGKSIELHMVFMGTIHTVVFVDDATTYLDSPLGEMLCHHPLFLEKTNVNFTSINSDNSLTVRTYERGVGYTKACGTGCCAAFVIANNLGLVSDKASVTLEQGALTIERKQKTIYMTGPARFHFETDLHF